VSAGPAPSAAKVLDARIRSVVNDICYNCAVSEERCDGSLRQARNFNRTASLSVHSCTAGVPLPSNGAHVYFF